MFAIHCPAAGTRVLIWASQVHDLRNTARGIELSFRCSCGAPGVWLTGRAASREGVLCHGERPSAATAA